MKHTTTDFANHIVREQTQTLRSVLGESRAMTAYEKATDDFAEAMKARLRQKANAGYSGWDADRFTRAYDYYPSDCTMRLVAHVAEAIHNPDNPQKWVDIANFAMFMWNATKGEQ